MSSFDAINYSLRPSKSIQRQIVFEGVGLLKSRLDLDRLMYIGFGSIWFTDFVIAHRVLGVDDMISIEGNDVGYKRAVFNSPYATVRVEHGMSGEVLPKLFADTGIRNRPWLIWLDYDYSLDESVRDDIRAVIENAPVNSILLATFNGHEMGYGRTPERPDRLRELLGALVPDDLPKADCRDDRMQETLADLSLGYMQSVAAEVARPGGFVPAFRVLYRDGAPMVTIGGILPARGAARIAADLVAEPTWPCRPAVPIKAPHLTLREAAVLQSQLPRSGQLTRAAVQALGFDLEEDQLSAFETYYRQYPAFAQIVS
jgi:hypothetical protein